MQVLLGFSSRHFIQAVTSALPELRSGWHSIKPLVRALQLHYHHHLFCTTVLSCYFLSRPHYIGVNYLCYLNYMLQFSFQPLVFLSLLWSLQKTRAKKLFAVLFYICYKAICLSKLLEKPISLPASCHAIFTFLKKSFLSTKQKHKYMQNTWPTTRSWPEIRLWYQKLQNNLFSYTQVLKMHLIFVKICEERTFHFENVSEY